MTTKDTIKTTIRHLKLPPEIEKILLFGSFLTGDPDDKSDIDLIVVFSSQSKVGFFKLAEIQKILKEALQREVDILTINSLNPYLKDKILKNTEVIYEKE